MKTNENKEHEVRITTGDRLLRAWENSMELTRDFQIYSKEIKDNENVAQTFSELAEEECKHSSKLRELLLEYQSQNIR